MVTSTWDYSEDSWNTSTTDCLGYDVEASDGGIGSIDRTSNQAGSSYVVVDTGFWIFGKKRLIPAGAVTNVDHERRVVHVDMTRDQIRDAPDYDADAWGDDTRQEEARGQHDDYYREYSGRDRFRSDDGPVS